MGGIGSGRRNQGGRRTTMDMHALDVRRLHREGVLVPGRVLEWQWTVNDVEVASIRIRVQRDHIELIYRTRRSGAEWRGMEYPVALTRTACGYGGSRVWFVCPAKGCGRRVAILFGGEVFACRHCHDLRYETQRESQDDLAVRRAEKIRRRLGWQPGILNGAGLRPVRMRKGTFKRLAAEHDHHVGRALMAISDRLRLKIDKAGDFENFFDGLG